jgi:hypothetical protein
VLDLFGTLFRWSHSANIWKPPVPASALKLWFARILRDA